MRTPLSAKAYCELFKRATKKSYKLTSKTLQEFAKLDTLLFDLEVDPVDYMKTIVPILLDFAKAKGAPFPPPSMLCGVKALQIYKSSHPISDDDYYKSALLYVEHGVATLVVNSYIHNTVEELESSLAFWRGEFEKLTGRSWEHYTTNHPTELKEAQLNAIAGTARLYGVVKDGIKTYEDLAEIVLKEGTYNLHGR